MKNFIFGLTTGIVVGGFSAFVAAILGLVVLEDSPETLKVLADRSNN